MVLVSGGHNGFFAEFVDHSVGKAILNPQAHHALVAAVHIKHLCLLVGQVLGVVFLRALALLQKRDADTLHAVNAEIAELLAVVGIQIVVAVVPRESIRADDVLTAVFGIALRVVLVRGVMEVTEPDFAVGGDCLMDAVGILHDAIVHAADAVGNVCLPFQTVFRVVIGKGFEFAGDLAGFLLRDELGGLDAVHQQAQLVGLKLGLADVVAPLLGVVLYWNAEIVLKQENVVVDGLYRGFDALGGKELRDLAGVLGVVLVGALVEIVAYQKQLYALS